MVEKPHRGVIDVSDSHEENLELLGYVIGEASPVDFTFIVEEGKHPPRWEYVIVKSNEIVGDKEIQVDIVAQIYMIKSLSEALNLGIGVDAARKLIRAGLVDKRSIARARILGFLYNGEILQPRRAIHPSNEVYKAPPKILEQFYSYSKDEGLHVGYLINRPDVPVSITVRGFRRHLAILGQTGAGKSYTTGVLIEELLKKGATIVILDPHADYVFLSRKKDGSVFSKRIAVFRTRESTGRYSEEEIGKIETYEVKFSDLTLDEIITVSGIQWNWSNIVEALRKALEELRRKSKDYKLEDLIERLKKGDQHAVSVLKYVRRLEKLKVFGDTTTDIMNILKPKHVSIMDLSGLDDAVADYIAYRILNDIFNATKTQQYKYPVFVFIEEAHRFIPSKENTLSKRIIKRIAAEGRKFGVFLVVISQRPHKIDPDVLSQCNSQIILKMTNPEDQTAVRRSSERMSEDLLSDLPGLNTGEAVIVGEIVKAPVMVKIRLRETKEGGADIVIVSKLKKANRVAEEEEKSRMKKIKEEKKLIKDIVEEG